MLSCCTEEQIRDRTIGPHAENLRLRFVFPTDGDRTDGIIDPFEVSVDGPIEFAEVDAGTKYSSGGSSLPGSPTPTSRSSPSSPTKSAGAIRSFQERKGSWASTLSPIRSLRFAKGNSRDRKTIEDISEGPETLESLVMYDLDLHFEKMEILGQGKYGVVYKMRCKDTGGTFAVKTVYQKAGSSSGEVEDEIAHSGEFDHPYIVKLHAFFRETGKFHMVMDYCSGGDLRQFCTFAIMRRKAVDPRFDSGMEPKVAARFVYQMLSGLAYLHYHRFMHRDVKPENYLLADHEDGAPLKLTDFGLATRVGFGEKLTLSCGTIHYAAPEVLHGCYDQKADLWSLGVTAFGICTNRLPIAGNTERQFVENLKAGAVQDTRDEVWKQHSSRLRRVVWKMLVVDPEARASAKQVLVENAWLKAYGKNLVQDQSCCMPFL